MEKKVLLIILSFLIFGTCMNTPNVYASVTVAAGSDNDSVYVYNGAGNLLWSYGTDNIVASVAVSSDGAYIAVGSLENKLYLFTRDGTKLWEKTVPVSYGGNWNTRESKSVAISAHGEYVVAGCTDNLYVYRKDGTLHWSHGGKETCVGISPNGCYIVSCNKANGTIDFFSKTSSTPLWSKSIGAFWVATSNSGYVAASSHSIVCLYDNAGTQIWSYSHSKWNLDYIRVDMPKDGLSVAAVNDDPGDSQGSVLCYFNEMKDGTSGWSGADGTPVWTFIPNPDDPHNDFSSVAFSGNGDYIATGPPQGTYVFSSASNIPLQTFSMGSTQSIDLTCDGQFGACGNYEGGQTGRLYYFSKDQSTPLWSKLISGYVRTVALAYYEAPWPMFRHDLKHTGRSPFVGAQQANLKWTFTTGDAIRSSPAIGADGTIYVGCNDGNLYAINPDGTEKWSYPIGGNVYSSPAVGSDGTIYIASWRESGDCTGAVYAINPDGTLEWRYPDTGHISLEIESSPAIDPSSGVIYVGGACGSPWAGRMHAINPDGSLKWEFNPASSSGWITVSPAMNDDGKILFGDYTNPDGIFYALNPDDGSVFLQRVIPNPGGEIDIHSSAAIDSDGKIYFGGGYGDANVRLWALNPDLTIAWSFPTGGHVPGSPAIGPDGTIYVGSYDDKLYAINPNGTEKWAYPTGGDVYSSPAVGADGTIYVGSNDHNVYAIYPDGSLMWSYPTGGTVPSSPSIGSDGTIYVGSYDGKLYAFGPSTTAVELSSFTTTGYEDYIQVDWTTETEIDNAGFNLHRSLSKDGGYAQINKQLIPAQGMALQGASYSFTDTDVTNGITYYYWLEDVDLNGNSTMHGPVSATAGMTSVEERCQTITYNLRLAYSVGRTVSIAYSTPKNCWVNLRIYDAAGRAVGKLVNGMVEAGRYEITWNGENVPSGVYFCRMSTDEYTAIKKVVLLK